MSNYIPQDDETRKASPMYRGLLGYFPAALFEVAAHSAESNAKHNPGEPVHWARGKSSDHEDCILRHLIDAGARGTPGRRYHLRAVAWRALALLQEDCEADGATPGVGSVFPPPCMSAAELAAAEEDFAVEMYNEAYLPSRRAEPDVCDLAEQKALEGDRFANLRGGQ